MMKSLVFVALLAVATAASIKPTTQKVASIKPTVQKVASIKPVQPIAQKPALIKVTEEREIVPILSQGEEKNNDGSFAYFYEGADGGKRQEVGFLKNPGTEDEALVVKGSYRYIDANGDEVLVEYVADENGFQPHGTIIPKEISQAAVDAAVKSSLERSQAPKQKN